MTPLIVAVAFIAAGKAEPAPTLDGEWAVVAFEKRGETIAEAKDAFASIKDGMLSFPPKKDKPGLSSMKLAFTTANAVTVTEVVPELDKLPAPPPPRKGVYVLTKDYLVLSMMDDSPAKTGDPEPKTGDTVKPDRPNATPFCTVILKRVVVERR